MQKVPKKKVASVPKPSKPRRTKQAVAKRLLMLAEMHRPPQAWFEQTDRPFDPSKE
jgi:hypothetical protein